MKWYQMRWAQKYWGKEARERYRRYLQSDTWKAKRKAVLQASGYRCHQCGSPATEVHHETYKRIYNERLSDLTALCSERHKAVHSKKIRIPDQDPPSKTEQRNDYHRKRKSRTKNTSARRRRSYRGRRKNERHKTLGNNE